MNDELLDVVEDLHALVSNASQGFKDDLLIYKRALIVLSNSNGKMEQMDACASIVSFLYLMSDYREEFEEIFDWWNREGFSAVKRSIDE